MIKYIYFDLGGVYLNRGFWIANEIFSQKYKISEDRIVEVLVKKNYKKLFSGELSEDEYWRSSIEELGIDDTAEEMRKVLLNSYQVNQNLVNLIDNLRLKQKIGLLSDQTINWWDYFDNKFNISNHFDDIIISAKVGTNKPNPEIYQIMIERSNLKASEILFIDDLERNLPPANNLGINTILYTKVNKLKKDLLKCDVKFA